MKKSELKVLIKEEIKKTLNEWNSNNPFDVMALTDKEDLQDISTIQSFVEYHHLPKLIIDICKYAAEELNVYPIKITQQGMVFPSKGFNKVELEFKNNGQINLYKFRRNTLESTSPFEYKIFKDMITK